MLSTLPSIIHSTDAGIDDFVASAVISAAEKLYQGISPFNFSAVVITNADSEPTSALAAYQKTFQFFNSTIQIGLSAARVWTPFPWVWRMESESVNNIACLKAPYIHPLPYSEDGDVKLLKALSSSKNVSIVATGPLTSIAAILRQHPELESNIADIHWMGGALNVPGNLIGSPEIPQSILNDKAEWNVFSDPQSADWILKNTHVKMHIYPIDLSNQTDPLKFLEILGKKVTTVFSTYVSQCYQIVDDPAYRMWDVVAAAGKLFPQVFSPPHVVRIRVEASGPNQGAFVRDIEGREVLVYETFKNNDPTDFYNTVANVLAD